MKELTTFFDQKLPKQVEKLRNLETNISPDAMPETSDETYKELNSVLYQVVKDCGELDTALRGDDELLKETRSRFQKEFTPWLVKGWFGQRVVEKPRGYAGDYRTLIAIYDIDVKQPGYGGYVDRWMLQLMLSRAIRSRWQEMRKFLTKELSARSGEVSVLDIASGPAREFSKPLELTSDCNVTLQCLDNDPESLDFVRDNVVAASGIKDFRLDRYNALRLKSSKNTIRAYGKFDIVYSIGLFDYIDDTRLVQILSGVKDLVNEDGVIYLNFKDTKEYNEIEYQWLLDWHFFQRTEQDCLDLFAQAGYDMKCMEPTTRDETGVIINFVNRVSGADIRVDLGTKDVPRPKLSEAQTRAETKDSEGI